MTETTEALRTGAEIATRIEAIGDDDVLGFRREALAQFLPFDDAEAVRNPEVTREEWDKLTPELTRENVQKQLLDYLNFAFEKAINERGISAGRSIQKLGEWLWILRDDEAAAYINDDAYYEPYGAPALKWLAERYEVEVPDELARMAS